MLWIKSLHIISIVCWFAGIFYLPRLFVYHALAQEDTTRNHFKIMERKLYRFMSLFAMTSVIFGGWLMAFNWSYYWQARWFIAKIALVSLLIAYHFGCGYFVAKFQQNTCHHSHVFFRWFNELPVLILFAVVILVVVKPF